MQQRMKAICVALIALVFGWASAQDFAGSYKETVYGIVITIQHDGAWFGQMESGGATFPLTLVEVDNELTGTWVIDDETVGFSATLNDDYDLDFSLFEFTAAGEPDADSYEHYLAERLTPAPRRSLGGALAGGSPAAPSAPSAPQAPAPSMELPLEDFLVIDGVWEAEDDVFGIGVPTLVVYTFASGQFKLSFSIMGEEILWYSGGYQLQAEPGATGGVISMQITDYSPQMCFQGDCEPLHLTEEDMYGISEVELLNANSLRITEEDGSVDFTRTGDATAPPTLVAPTPPAPPARGGGAGSPPPPSAPPAPKLP